MEKEKIFYNALNLITEANFPLLNNLYQKYRSFSLIYQNLKKENLPSKITERYQAIQPEKEYQKLKEKKIYLILIEEENYPQILKEINSPPLGLYLKTSLPIEKIFKEKLVLAIVGTRKATKIGQEIAKKFAYEISSLGGTVVSGLAFGIDKSAHLGALEGKGLTLAVLANGLDFVYPQANYSLAEKIIQKGALISEYPLNSPSLPFRFLERNRIISGLSKGVLVVEAPSRSGALNTANHALEENREVFAIPGSIFSKNSAGCNFLIQKGAKLTTKLEDILEELKEQIDLEIINQKKEIEFNSSIEKNVFEFLKENERGLEFDEILKKFNLSFQELLNILSSLEIKNLVKKVGGRWKIFDL